MSTNHRVLSLLVITTLCLGHNGAKSASLHFQPPNPTTTHDFQAAASISVCLTLGCFINILDTTAIKVHQDAFKGGNPFTTYYGCGQIDIFTTFPAIIRASAKPASPAAGTWAATLENKAHLPISVGTSSIAVCVLGTQVQAHMLINSQAQKNVSVAQITIQVIPQ